MTDFGSKLHNLDQGVFSTTKAINNIPNVNLAFISNNNNIQHDLFKEATVDLNTIYLNYSDFTQLFFRGYGGAFHINPNNYNASVLSLTHQSYSTTHDSNNPFYLREFLIKTYEKAYNTSAINIPIQKRITLDREMFLAKSLSSINGYQSALSLDECINSLLMNGDVIKSDFDSAAKVIFIISLKYIQPDLKVSCVVNFKFITDIPGFSNNDAIMTLDLPKPYSNDIKKNITKPEVVRRNKKEYEYISDNASEISDYKHDEYNDLDDKSFSINSINSGISGKINNDERIIDDHRIDERAIDEHTIISSSQTLNTNDQRTVISSSQTLNTNLVKEVTNIIKSGESVINSVAW
jgi:hypothetical protein